MLKKNSPGSTQRVHASGINCLPAVARLAVRYGFVECVYRVGLTLWKTDGSGIAARRHNCDLSRSIENKFNKSYERLYEFVLVVHCLCVIPVYVDIPKRVEVQSSMY